MAIKDISGRPNGEIPVWVARARETKRKRMSQERALFLRNEHIRLFGKPPKIICRDCGYQSCDCI